MTCEIANTISAICIINNKFLNEIPDQDFTREFKLTLKGIIMMYCTARAMAATPLTSWGNENLIYNYFDGANSVIWC